MPLRNYTNKAASGTMMQSRAQKEPIDNVIDRVMLLGQRLVAAEDAIKNQASEIVGLKENYQKTRIRSRRLHSSFHCKGSKGTSDSFCSSS